MKSPARRDKSNSISIKALARGRYKHTLERLLKEIL